MDLKAVGARNPTKRPVRYRDAVSSDSDVVKVQPAAKKTRHQLLQDLLDAPPKKLEDALAVFDVQLTKAIHTLSEAAAGMKDEHRAVVIQLLQAVDKAMEASQEAVDADHRAAEARRVEQAEKAARVAVVIEDEEEEVNEGEDEVPDV